MTQHRNPLLILLFTLLVSLAWQARDCSAQAYCALRDPTHQIYQLYPQANAYRSVVRTVDETARQTIIATVPYPMHFTELGRHTLYIALDGQQPVGLVQSRSERSRHGLVEVVWAFDLDLKVKDFALQRCRAGADERSAIESSAFKQRVIGRSFDQMVQLLSQDGQRLSAQAKPMLPSKQGQDLAVVVLRCGIKTMAAMNAVWAGDIAVSRQLPLVLPFFPKAQQLAPIQTVYSPAVLSQLNAQDQAAASAIDRAQTKLIRVTDGQQTIGLLGQTPCRFGEQKMVLRWAIDPQGRILDIAAQGPLDELTQTALASLQHRTLDTINQSDCSGPLQWVAIEFLTVAQAHLQPPSPAGSR